MPKLDAIMAQKIKSNTEKKPNWTIDKFQKVKEHIDEAATDATKLLKTKWVLQKMKRVANKIGNPEMSSAKKKQHAARKTHSKKQDRPTAPVPVPPELLNTVFEKRDRGR
jgi:hypothetical protein